MRGTGPQDRKWWAQLGILSTMGIAMAISVATGVLGGYFLDKWLGTKFFFWIGLVVGILAAYRNLWVFYTKYMREPPAEKPPPEGKRQ
ncbi:MAG: AtpZ/AtpI family protein [bacterium]